MPTLPEPGLGMPENGAIIEGDNREVLATLPDGAFTMIYIDPPFNTGRTQRRHTTTSVRVADGEGSITGFKGRSYEQIRGALRTYDDTFDDYWAFLEPRLFEAWRLLADDGTLYLHLDYREAHYAKVLLDAIFGRESFLNEIIWAYDYGAKARRRWPTKHDTILVYVKNPETYYFNSDEVDREPYMAPGLVTPEKVARGKLPTDVWWHTIVSPTGKEKTGYPTQKPLGILRRIIQASTREGDWVLDFFAGSGTTGAAAAQLGRNYVLVDANPEAIAVMRDRLGGNAADDADPGVGATPSAGGPDSALATPADPETAPKTKPKTKAKAAPKVKTAAKPKAPARAKAKTGARPQSKAAATPTAAATPNPKPTAAARPKPTPQPKAAATPALEAAPSLAPEPEAETAPAQSPEPAPER